MTVLDDAEGIRECITRLIHAIDRKRWAELGPQCSATVETDYRSLFGGEVQRQPAEDLIASWRKVLAPMTATQHLLGPIGVEISATSVAAQCHVRAYHYMAGPSGTDLWMVAGHYRFALEKTAAGWKINGITLEVIHQ